MPSPVGLLENLDQSEKDTLISWIEALPLKAVLDKVAAPSPDGFGIRTHITSLRRFYAREQARAAVHVLEIARERLVSDPSAAADFQKAALSALMHQAFQLTADPNLNETKFRAISAWLSTVQQNEIAWQKLQLARERLLLERQKLQFDAKCKAITANTFKEESEFNTAMESVLQGYPSSTSQLEHSKTHQNTP